MTDNKTRNALVLYEEIVVPSPIIVQIAKSIPPEQSDVFQSWLRQLLQIRDLPISNVKKGAKAIALTLDVKLLWPSVKLIAAEIKKHGWDNRRRSHRVGLSAAAVGLAVFGNQAAGIAALGSAIGVPLWIVLGAGSMFADQLLKELSGALSASKKTSENEPGFKETYRDTIDLSANREK